MRKYLTVADSSDQAVRLTVWGDDCLKPCFKLNSIFAIKSAKIREWNYQKSLQITYKSKIVENIDDEYR